MPLKLSLPYTSVYVFEKDFWERLLRSLRYIYCVHSTIYKRIWLNMYINMYICMHYCNQINNNNLQRWFAWLNFNKPALPCCVNCFWSFSLALLQCIALKVKRVSDIKESTSASTHRRLNSCLSPADSCL